jgi:hypothetical protein
MVQLLYLCELTEKIWKTGSHTLKRSKASTTKPKLPFPSCRLMMNLSLMTSPSRNTYSLLLLVVLLLLLLQFVAFLFCLSASAA